MALARKKKPIQEWREKILAHHNRKQVAKPKRKRNTDPDYMTKPKVRAAVIERDGGNWCAISGVPGPNLQLHRIVYGSQGGKYEVDNCILLSKAMHDIVHSDKKKWMPILQDHVRCMKLGMPEKSPIQRITHQ
ncbi:HNH endonuclease [Paenibacillus sp. UASWS1643]|uniref:HNH endonuclease n=1 Tax=Paenibacillus sp. UASWS1643 TaxID=2580422 RepID=UPI00123897CD|nr:HNH endonuclease [Paenibacillus sp. UASWS1643]KAA8747138.1 HNH endonuclease [Paenibacillus sp. UASWS1643]